MTYRCILADPPWQQPTIGRFTKRRIAKVGKGEFLQYGRLPYPTMTVAEIAALPVADHAANGAHLWLWATNARLRDAFDVMEAWGFTYLAPVTWVKPSGVGAWFVHRTEHLLFGYRGRCEFPLARYRPTVLYAPRPAANRHSTKPEASYDLIESISPGPRIELFARRPRLGWHVFGNEVVSDVELAA